MFMAISSRVVVFHPIAGMKLCLALYGCGDEQPSTLLYNWQLEGW